MGVEGCVNTTPFRWSTLTLTRGGSFVTQGVLAGDTVGIHTFKRWSVTITACYGLNGRGIGLACITLPRPRRLSTTSLSALSSPNYTAFRSMPREKPVQHSHRSVL